MTYETEKQYQANQAKPKIKLGLGVSIALSLMALFFGVAIGAATAVGAESATPQPVKTVQVEVPAAVETGTCRDVAEELYDILQTTTSDVMIPQNGVVQALVDMLRYGVDIQQVEESTATMQRIADTTSTLTDRANVLAPDYQRCVNP